MWNWGTRSKEALLPEGKSRDFLRLLLLLFFIDGILRIGITDRGKPPIGFSNLKEPHEKMKKTNEKHLSPTFSQLPQGAEPINFPNSKNEKKDCPDFPWRDRVPPTYYPDPLYFTDFPN